MSKKVLVVDDSATVRGQVCTALEQAGYAVVEAENGQQGYACASREGDLSMIVCDVNMPVMNGIEMLQKLHADGCSTPTMMLTTEGDPELIRQAKAAGAKCWMVKPFDAAQLVMVAEKLTAA
jgi:two-component system chemotaxis response regulator CheY